MTAHIDPKRYGAIIVAAIGSRPVASAVAEKTAFIATDERKVYVQLEGEWIDVADLTAAIPWSDILSKPSTFPPSLHDLDTGHTGTIGINRVRGHDAWDPEHEQNILLAMTLGDL